MLALTAGNAFTSSILLLSSVCIGLFNRVWTDYSFVRHAFRAWVQDVISLREADWAVHRVQSRSITGENRIWCQEVPLGLALPGIAGLARKAWKCIVMIRLVLLTSPSPWIPEPRSKSVGKPLVRSWPTSFPLLTSGNGFLYLTPIN